MKGHVPGRKDKPDLNRYSMTSFFVWRDTRLGFLSLQEVIRTPNGNALDFSVSRFHTPVLRGSSMSYCI